MSNKRKGDFGNRNSHDQKIDKFCCSIVEKIAHSGYFEKRKLIEREKIESDFCNVRRVRWRSREL